MKTRKTISKRILSIFLCVVLTLSCLPVMSFLASAANDSDPRITDPVTWDLWKHGLGSKTGTTENAGSVWTDKSVFKTDAETINQYFGDVEGLTIDDADNNFLIALSALASNKSITGYSHAVTDTILVLDISNSMRYAHFGESESERNDVVQPMIDAANAAITELLALNKQNRVGVVLYSSGNYGSSSNNGWPGGNNDSDRAAKVLMPLGRYTSATTETYNSGTPDVTSDDKTINVYFTTDANGSHNGDEISVVDGVKNEATGNPFTHYDVDVSGGTYIQSGIDLAMDTLLAVEDTTIEGEGFQSGSNRKPVVVLLSDGEPTYGTTSYDNVGNSNLGSGSSSNARITFATQLTAAYAKRKISEHYNGEAALFYTLGFKVSGHAIGVLNPEKYTETDSYWTSFLAAEDGANITVGTGKNGKGGTTFKKNSYVTADYRYYVDGYYSADTEAQLYKAFDNIVAQIILQSLYSPTKVENGDIDMGGYLEFHDDIGEYMEIKSIKGVMLGNTLFTGAQLARNFTADGGDLGTIENPNEVGNNMVWAVQQRLGIETVEEARSLIHLAYEAGQLSYTSDTEFSNYIGWYADADGKFLGFWKEGYTEADYPKDADGNTVTPTYINKSYGMLGSVEDGHKKSDMMYASIQVHQNITTGEIQLIWKIPSSLIPVVNYEISLEGKSLEDFDPDTLKVTVEDKSPIRLIFEVGLRSDINAINVSGKVDPRYLYKDYNNNEGYTFFTNKWTADEVEMRADPIEAENTISYFEPSFENEFYYYTENTPIWEFDGTNYTRYMGEEAPDMNGEYYREFNVFKFASDGKATLETYHERISSYVLNPENSRIAKNDNNTWYVKPDTIHRYFDELTVNKSDNTTASLPQMQIPAVQLNEHNHYYADAILGNNGAYVLKPAQGIKISKAIDVISPGTNTDFTFKITGTEADNGKTYETLLVAADGTETKGTVTFAKDGDSVYATVGLAVNQSIYVVGMPDNAAYTVEELDNNTHYKLKSAALNGVTDADGKVEVAVKHFEIDEIDFVNTAKIPGKLIIRKTVTHPFAADPEALENIDFEFEVTVTTDEDLENGNSPIDLTWSDELKPSNPFVEFTPTGEENTYKLTDGGENLKLAHNEFVSISGLPTGAKVTVKEINIPDGFTSDKENNTDTATIKWDENVAIRFTNDYNPSEVSPTNVTVQGSKKVTGRDWLDDDEFEFKLQRLDGSVWVDLGTDTATKASPTFDFSAAIQSEVYTAAGVYAYRVTESAGTAGGVTYDDTVYYFDITVTDTDMDGKLEIGNVTSTYTDVVKTDDSYKVNVEFDNKYAPKDSGDITINIKKTMNDTTEGADISLAGYQFGLYTENSDGQLELQATSNVTSAAGEAQIKMIYLADMLIDSDGSNLGELTLDYVLKEIVPDSKVPGVEYNTSAAFDVKVVLTDNLRGKVDAVVYLDEDGADASTATAVLGGIEIQNTYDPADAEESFTAKKTMSGRNPDGGEFTFELYNATVAGGVWSKNGTAIQTKQNDADGNIAFDELTFDKIKNYYYIVEEKPGTNNGVEYDDTKYYITVAVTDNGDGTLKSEVTVTDDSFAGVTDIEFKNEYTASGTLDGFTAKKTVSGRPMQSFDIFDFELYEADSSWNTVGSAIQTKQNATDGSIAFDVIGYDLDDVGTKYYIIKEKAGQDGDGITCTTVEYRITVTVADNKDGTLTAAVASITDANGAAKTEMEFVNTYKATGEVKVPLTGTKKLEGRNWLGTDEFTFEIYEATVEGGQWTAKGAAVQSKTVKGESITFDELKFTAADTYYYIVKEKAGKAGVGIDYSDAEYHVTIKIKDDYATGKFAFESKTITDKNGNTAEIKFINKYSATGTYADLTATKELSGIRDLEAGEFSFELYKAKADWSKDGNAIQTKQNDKFGNVKFDRIEYSTVGTNRYILVETQGTKGGVDYSKSEYRITVEVTDNNVGALVAETTITDKNGAEAEPKFINFYTVTGTDATFTAKKNLTGKDLESGEFDFELYNATVAGGVWAAEGDAIQTKSNGSGQTVNYIQFDKIEYSAVGTNYYIIKEKKGDNKRVDYSEAEYYVTVQVKDNKLGALVATTTVTDKDGNAADAVFENVYTPKPEDITVDFAVNKTVKNTGDLKIGPEGFSFKLVGDTEELTVKTDTDGKAKFTLTFSEDDIGKTYTYTLTEVDEGKDNITYSTVSYIYEITVKLNSDNTLSAAIKQDGEEVENASADFENIYDKDEEKEPEDDGNDGDTNPPADKPENNDDTSPKTGADRSVILLAALMLLSSGFFAGAAVLRKKGKNK